MEAKKKLIKLKNGNMFTCDLSLKEYIKDLCNRFAKIFNEILPIGNYAYIVIKLEEKGIL